MTVVATRTSTSPAANARIDLVLGLGRHPAVQLLQPQAVQRPLHEPRRHLLDRGEGAGLLLVRLVLGLVQPLVETLLVEGRGLVVGRDARAHDVDLAALPDLLADARPDPVEPAWLVGERHDRRLRWGPDRPGAR